MGKELQCSLTEDILLKCLEAADKMLEDQAIDFQRRTTVEAISRKLSDPDLVGFSTDYLEKSVIGMNKYLKFEKRLRDAFQGREELRFGYQYFSRFIEKQITARKSLSFNEYIASVVPETNTVYTEFKKDLAKLDQSGGQDIISYLSNNKYLIPTRLNRVILDLMDCKDITVSETLKWFMFSSPDSFNFDDAGLIFKFADDSLNPDLPAMKDIPGMISKFGTSILIFGKDYTRVREIAIGAQMPASFGFYNYLSILLITTKTTDKIALKVSDMTPSVKKVFGELFRSNGLDKQFTNVYDSLDISLRKK